MFIAQQIRVNNKATRQIPSIKQPRLVKRHDLQGSIKLSTAAIYSHLSLDRKPLPTAKNDKLCIFQKELRALQIKLCAVCKERVTQAGHLLDLEKYVAQLPTCS